MRHAANANARALDLTATIRIQTDGCTLCRTIAGRLNEMSIPTTGSHNKNGLPTGHGSTWTGVQVGRILSRLAAIGTPAN